PGLPESRQPLAMATGAVRGCAPGQEVALGSDRSRRVRHAWRFTGHAEGAFKPGSAQLGRHGRGWPIRNESEQLGDRFHWQEEAVIVVGKALESIPLV